MLVHLWRREQGLVVARGNPLGIRGVADLAGRRLAWRAPGTASRLLLERLLLEAGTDPRPGLEEAFDSHLGVAAAVGTGAADAGLAVRTVAHSAELDWIPVARSRSSWRCAPLATPMPLRAHVPLGTRPPRPGDRLSARLDPALAAILQPHDGLMI